MEWNERERRVESRMMLRDEDRSVLSGIDTESDRHSRAQECMSKRVSGGVVLYGQRKKQEEAAERNNGHGPVEKEPKATHTHQKATGTCECE